jgi:plasmid maintenance system antidote protein VapI
MDMRSILQLEFNRRRARNPRYSLRAFANALGTHHSTLSQMMQARRRLTTRTIRRFGHKLGLSAPAALPPRVDHVRPTNLDPLGDERCRTR